jgi:hypothetical protein
VAVQNGRSRLHTVLLLAKEEAPRYPFSLQFVLDAVGVGVKASSLQTLWYVPCFTDFQEKALKPAMLNDIRRHKK